MVGLFVIDITVKMKMGDNSEYYLGAWILPMKNQWPQVKTFFKSSLFKMVQKNLSTNCFDTPELLMSAPVENNI